MALGLIQDGGNINMDIPATPAIEIIDRCLNFNAALAGEFSNGVSPMMQAVLAQLTGDRNGGANVMDMDDHSAEHLLEKINSLKEFALKAVGIYGSKALLVFS